MSTPPPSTAASLPAARARALAALVLVQVLFGLWPVLGKLAIPAFGAGGLGILRIGGATIAFAALARLARVPPIPWRDQPRIVVLSVLGISANQLLYVHGLARTSATHAALLTTTIPIQTMIVALLLGKERFLPMRVAGALVSLVGVVVLVTGRSTGGDVTVAGDLLVMANTVVYALYLILSRDILARHSPLAVLPWLFGWGFLGALPFTGIPPLAGHRPESWVALAVIVLGPTVGTYWLNLVALRTVPSSVVAIFIALQPVVAGALAVPLLGEKPTLRAAFSAVLTLAGVLLATRAAGAPHEKTTTRAPSEG